MAVDIKQKYSLFKYTSRLAIGSVKRKLFRPKSYTYKGVRIEIDYANIPSHIIDHMLAGLYETAELSVIEQLLEPDDVVVDIGAGIGFVSAFIARGLNEKGSIECFEANPALISKIEKTHKINGVNVKVNNIILGEFGGDVDFYVSPHFWASSTIEAPGTTRCKIPSASFQQYIYKHKPTMIVVDIEGGEIELFDNLDFSSIRKICVELHPNYTGLDKMYSMLEYMKSQGFQLREDISQPAVKALIRA